MSTIRRPADIARRSAQALAGRKSPRDAFRRETFALPREAAREKAREMFRRFPKAAYMTEIEVLARAAGRPHRVHHAAAAERGLSGCSTTTDVSAIPICGSLTSQADGSLTPRKTNSDWRDACHASQFWTAPT